MTRLRVMAACALLATLPVSCVAQPTQPSTQESGASAPQDAPRSGRELRLDDSPRAEGWASARTAEDGSGDSGLVLDAGDALRFSLLGYPEMDTVIVVRGDGRTTLPLIGEFTIGGLSLERARQQIAWLYQLHSDLDNPQVDLQLERRRGQAVEQPQWEAPAASGETYAMQETPAATRAPGPEPQPVGPAESHGVLGEGDALHFSLFGQPDLDTVVVVSGEGKITLPMIGEISVGGLTLTQAQRHVAQAYEDGGFIRNPQVNLRFDQRRSQQIAVLGEVNQPGRYPLEMRTTVFDALAVAGGVKAGGTWNVVLIRSEQGEMRRYHLDLSNVARGADGADGNNLYLRGGDVVFVPEPSRFFIYGEVRRPDAYDIKPGMTVMQAISVGGGLTDRGTDRRIRIRRRDSDGNLTTIRAGLSDLVQPGDVIVIRERMF